MVVQRALEQKWSVTEFMNVIANNLNKGSDDFIE